MSDVLVPEKTSVLQWPGKIARGIGRFLKLMSRNKTGFLGFLIFIGFVLMTTVGTLFVPQSTSADIMAIYAPPSREHPLGTDSQGKDILSQIVHGGRDILEMALLTGLISTFVGISLGSVSALIGGRFDAFLTMLADIWLTIPRFPLLAVLATLIKLDDLLTVSYTHLTLPTKRIV